jgi:uncharacterized protein (TIGR04255 family)
MRVASMVVGPGGPSAGTTEAFNGWHLKSEDNAWTAALMPGHFSLETTTYTRWTEFEGRLSDLAAAIAAVASPVMEQRVGLRYVDRLVGLDVRDPAGWSRWIRGPILGPPLHPVLGAAVVSTRQQIDLDLGDGDLCVVRHGTLRDLDAPRDAEAIYLLDFDIYRSQSRRFSATEILDSTRAFHEKADALFEQVITEDLMRYLAGEHNV